MIGLLVAIRNVTIAVLLAWMGFSVSPDNDDSGDSNSSAPSSRAISAILG